jgi:hypothetical protein
VIDAEFGREDHNSILHNYDREGLEPLDARTDPKPDSIGGKNKKKTFISMLYKNYTLIFYLSKGK